MTFKVGQEYTAHEITSGEFRGIYDQLIGLVDGQLEHFTDWWDELADELQEDRDSQFSRSEAYDDALERIKQDVWVAYENAKEIVIFQGIAPGRTFDVYSSYKCISKEKANV